MSKKLVTILCTFILCLCLALPACGKNPDGETNDNESNTEQSGGIDSEENEEITEMYITVNAFKLKVTLERNSSVEALIDVLKQEDIIYTAYGNSFEIYGDIGHNLPTNNTQITSQAGDVLLWAGNNICIFFGNNSYSYTRIGKIEGYSAELLKSMLETDGSVQVKLSLK